MQQYDKYKDSGIDWLGEIPEHWEIHKFKYFAKLKSIIYNSQEDLLSIYLDKGVIKFNEVDAKRTNVTSLDLSKYQLVEEGDFVLNNQQAWRGSVGVSDYRGIVSPAYIVLDLLGKYNKKFANYLFRDKIMITYYLLNSKGVGTIQRNLYWPSLKEALTYCPPLLEQKSIADFLDDKCEKIDAAVSLKEQQIENLKELRQITIHNAVTRGLPRHAEPVEASLPMKDSGIDWIGEIPEHWEVKRFKFLCSITTGNKNTEDKVENGMYPFYVRSQIEERINSYSFDGEAILTAGDGAGVGKVYHYVNGKFDFHQRVYKFSDFSEVIGKYLYMYLLSEFYNVAILGTAKSTVDSLRLPLIQDFMIAYPNNKIEQKAIVTYLEEQTSKTDKAIAQKQEQIIKLKEYKQSLINEVVTGKVKVTA